VLILTIFDQNTNYMDIGVNIKRLREDRNIKQSEIADLIGMHRSNYSKIENGQREISLAAVDKIAKFFNITIDELVHLGGDIPREVSLEDKSTVEQVKLIQELDQEEKNMVFKMIETFLTKKKFKDFFQKNIAVL
jgi:transcriptional regulator with XRE-family HTH domain